MSFPSHATLVTIWHTAACGPLSDEKSSRMLGPGECVTVNVVLREFACGCSIWLRRSLNRSACIAERNNSAIAPIRTRAIDHCSFPLCILTRNIIFHASLHERSCVVVFSATTYPREDDGTRLDAYGGSPAWWSWSIFAA